MKILIAIASAAFISLAAAAPASAAPATSPVAQSVDGLLTQIQYAPRRHDGRRGPPARMRHAPPPRRHHYRAGGRYHSAPHGWHRYDRRPGDWSRRGCITVGALWFCP